MTVSTTIWSYADFHSNLMCNKAPIDETKSICGALIVMNIKVPMDDSIRYAVVVFGIAIGWLFSLAAWSNWTDKSNGNKFSETLDEVLKQIEPDLNTEASKIRISTSVAFVLIASFFNFFLLFLIGFMKTKREPLLKNDEEDFTTLEET